MLPTFRLKSLIALFLVMSLGTVPAAFGKMHASGTPSPIDAPRLVGSTRTLLPDGRLLMTGGMDRLGHVSRTLIVADPATGAVTLLHTELRFARAAHTATVLPNGTVLIFGGVGQDGKIVATTEVFDPVAGSVGVSNFAVPTPRAFHTATLVTDGRVLLAGGVLATGSSAKSIEFWDARGKVSLTLASPLMDRRNHSAILLPDGSVLFVGGESQDGRPVYQAQVFDPQSGTLTGGSDQVIQDSGADLTEIRASIPQDGAQDVPLDALIAVRFSRPVQMASFNSSAISLQGPDGVVAARVVSAEGGMLGFVTPVAPLLPATSYTVTISGVTDVRSQTVAYAQVSFTTPGAAPSGPATSEDEDWLPSSPADWMTHRPHSEYEALPDLQAPKGTTALSGQVLKLNGDPLPQVTLTIGTRTVLSDRSGRFLLKDIPAGHQVLVIDGATAGTAKRKYGRFEFGDEIKAGTTNKLDFKIWMTRLDTAHEITIPSPTTKETTLTTPTMPGLELRLPAGTVITDANGNAVRKITITPIPTDRPPFPLPFVVVPTYFTIQPGGAYISVSGKGSKGARLFYPNTEHKKPGVPFAFWNYNPDENGWYVYGAGRVNQQRTQVVPDPGVIIYEFSGAMVGSGNAGPSTGNPVGDFSNDSDPVSLSTGLFVYNKMDLQVSDVMPINLQRTYRPNDSWSRPFGIGSTHPYEMFLGGDGNDYGGTQYIDLILPDGSRAHFTGMGPGPSYSTYLNSSAGSPWYGAIISQPGPTVLRTRDGTSYSFLESPGLINPGCQALIGITDRNGNQITISRNGDANCTISQITSPSGRYIQFQYDSSLRIKVASDNLGRQVLYNYDASGRLWTVTDPNGGVWTYGYDSLNRMTTIQDPRQITYVTNVYDGNGMVHYQYQADGTSFYQFNYTTTSFLQNSTFAVGGSVPPYNVLAFRSCTSCSEGFPAMVSQVDVIDPRGFTRRVSFNSNGYTSSDIRALGMPEQTTTTFSYLPDNLMGSVTDQLGRVTSRTYDANANITSITKLAGTANAVTTSVTYDPAYSNILSLTDPLGNVTSWQYDINGNVTSVTDPLQHSTTFAHNAMGLLTSATDNLQNTTQFRYDIGDLVAVTDPLLNTSTMFRDAAGRILGITDPLGHTAKIRYNNLDEVTQITDPLQGVTSYTYDLDGNLQSVQDARQQGTNNMTVYTYDNYGHVQTRTDPLLRQESYAFDQLDNLTSFSDRRGKVTTYQYDGLNRRTFAGFGTQPGPTYESTISYSYDGGNRMTRIVDSLAGTITPVLDGLNRLTSETTPQGAITYQYDNDSRLTSATVTGQPSACYSYDNASRLTGIGQGTCPTTTNVVTITYDSIDRRNTLTLPNGILLTYGYDGDSRVNSMTYTMGTTTVGNLTYNFDAAGRVITKGGSLAATGFPNAVSSATYDVANQLTNWNGTTIGYDGNGNIQNDGTAAYTWNARNQLTSRGTATYQYDGLGRRTLNPLGSQLLYQGANVVQELSGTTPTANSLLGGIDELFGRTDSSGAFSYLTDVQGSILALTNTSGSVITQYSYDPFGNTASSGAISSNASQYTGRENDGNGLYFYRNRYYHPGLQRFVSEDPARLSGGTTNFYSYVGNNPVGSTDPFGLFAPAWHTTITDNAATLAGYGYFAAQLLAWETMRVDFRNCWYVFGGGSDCSQNTDAYHSNTHAMAGKKPNGVPQTCDQAYQGAQKQLIEDINSGDTPKALHTIEDSYAGGHRGFQYWPGGMPSASHEHDDWFPSQETVNEATQAAAQFLRDLDANRSALNAGNSIDVAKYFPFDPCGN